MHRQCYERVDELLTQGYQFWNEFGLEPLSEEDKHFTIDAILPYYSGEHAINFACACQCFYLFRRLHNEIEGNEETATLLGDYFFSQFAQFVIPIDRTELINQFSEFLSGDAQEGANGNKIFNKEKFKTFITSISVEIIQ